MVCTGCGRTVDASAQFCSGCGRPLVVYTAPPVTGRLVRPREERMIAGVCAGFALRYGWDVALVRLILVLAVVFGAGMPLVAYVIAWIVMPNAPFSLPAQIGFQPGVPSAAQTAPPAEVQTGSGPGSMAV